MGENYDAVVAGAGPAGLGIAKALVERGLKVACVDPDPGRRWTNNTSTWADEINPLGLDVYCDRIWPRAEVIFGERSCQVFNRGYTHFDNDLLKQALTPPGLEMVEGAGGRGGTRPQRQRGQAGGRRQAPRHPGLRRHRARPRPAALGPRGRLLPERLRHPGPREPPPLRSGPHAADGLPPRLPGQPHLAPHLPLRHALGPRLRLLRGDLPGRLARRPLRGPAGAPVPAPGQPGYRGAERGIGGGGGAAHERPPARFPASRVIGFGAAGGFVQASTGWSVGHSLRLAGPVSELVASGLGEGLAPEEISRRVYELVWTPALLRMRRFHLRGGEFFGHVGIRTLSVFMKAFFNAPGEIWKVYLSNDCTILGIDRALARGIRDAWHPPAIKDEVRKPGRQDAHRARKRRSPGQVDQGHQRRPALQCRLVGEVVGAVGYQPQQGAVHQNLQVTGSLVQRRHHHQGRKTQDVDQVEGARRHQAGFSASRWPMRAG